jgi:hypothetical protein
MTGTGYRSQARPRRDAFAPLLRAEWVKFRTVRGRACTSRWTATAASPPG